MLVPVPEPADFRESWRHAEQAQGWLTRDQALVLHTEGQRVAGGTTVEIGSHHGRSTIVLAGSGPRVIAIDPFPEDWRYGAGDTLQRFRDNLAAAGLDHRVELHHTTSEATLRTWSGERVHLLYIDGKHDALSCLRDLRWTRFQQEGDRFLVHDAFSSLGVTLALLWWLLRDRRTRFLGRTGSLALYEVAPSTAADRGRVIAQLPWFVRNLGIKVLLRLGLHPVARRLGHDDMADPY